MAGILAGVVILFPTEKNKIRKTSYYQHRGVDHMEGIHPSEFWRVLSSNIVPVEDTDKYYTLPVVRYPTVPEGDQDIPELGSGEIFDILTFTHTISAPEWTSCDKMKHVWNRMFT